MKGFKAQVFLTGPFANTQEKRKGWVALMRRSWTHKQSVFKNIICVRGGFALVELLVVVAIVGVLASIVLLRSDDSVAQARLARCTYNAGVGQKAYSAYLALGGTHNPVGETGTAFLVGAGFLVVELTGGTYTWTQAANGNVILNCSVDGRTVGPLSPLGSTLPEISGGMIQLLEAFYVANGRYARTWGDYVYTDIGLNPEDWQAPIGHILYVPVGNRLHIRPEVGYQFTVANVVTGTTMTMKDTSNWNLIYDLATTKWYYHRILPENEIDITTLQVAKY